MPSEFLLDKSPFSHVTEAFEDGLFLPVLLSGAKPRAGERVCENSDNPPDPARRRR